MVKLLAVLVLAGASVNAQTITQTFGTGANQFSIEFVEIGNPGNIADTSPWVATPLGSVSYVYNLGKFEVSRDQIIKANTAGGLGVTLQDLTNYGGNGVNRPATGISWNEAARFVNWLNTSRGYQAAYNFTTSGVNDNITLWAAGQYSGSNQYRHKDAYFFLPSRDEWYKGAYGSSSGVWYDYPNGSNTNPTSVGGGTSGAVYGRSNSLGPADVTNAGGLSPYGTMAQGGNAEEWIESAYDLSNDSSSDQRELRGDFWHGSGSNFEAANRWLNNPTAEEYMYGFRIAMIPEPSSFSLLLAGGAVLMAGRRRK